MLISDPLKHRTTNLIFVYFSRLAPLTIADDEDDDGVGHVSYTVITSFRIEITKKKELNKTIT